VKRVVASSKTKFAHLIQVRHRDEVEPPMTDWLQDAYELSAPKAAKTKKTKKTKNAKNNRKKPAAS
jgi:hypothetical protein